MAGVTRATKDRTTSTTSSKAEAPRRATTTGARATRAASRQTKDGTALTSQLESELVAEAEAGYDPDSLAPRRVGRPPLSSSGGTSHKISVRVDDQTYEMIKKVAELTNRSPSELIREVLQAAYPRK
jgi:hypothetical protein